MHSALDGSGRFTRVTTRYTLHSPGKPLQPSYVPTLPTTGPTQRRSIGVCVALLGFLAAQIGFPIAMRPTSVSSSATAGQVRPCGCPVAAVADQCQTCCCGPKKAVTASCCQSQAAKKPAVRSCCQTEVAKTPDTPDRHEDKPASAGTPYTSVVHIEWVIGSLLQSCHGLQTCWIALGAVLPLANHVQVPVDPHLPEWVPFTEAIGFLLCAPPNDPPPRIPSV